MFQKDNWLVWMMSVVQVGFFAGCLVWHAWFPHDSVDNLASAALLGTVVLLVFVALGDVNRLAAAAIPLVVAWALFNGYLTGAPGLVWILLLGVAAAAGVTGYRPDGSPACPRWVVFCEELSIANVIAYPIVFWIWRTRCVRV